MTHTGSFDIKKIYRTRGTGLECPAQVDTSVV